MERNQHRLRVLILIGLVLFGYYKIFFGADFFTEEDPATIYGYSHGNAVGNGWRPDKGFGVSFFFGDPGAFHAWSLFSLWEKLFSAPHRAYNISIVTLLIVAALSQYIFLVNLVPGIGSVACLLAPLIVFGPLQYEFFFQRHWITLSIGTPLLLLLLVDFLRENKFVHFLAIGPLFWFVLFFGSFAALEELLVVGSVFAIVYGAFHNRLVLASIVKSAILFSIGAASTLLLGAWAFYSIILESRLMHYVRDPNYAAGYSVCLTSLIQFLTGLLHSSWFPPVPMARPSSLDTTSWTNCSPVMPVVMAAVVFRRAKTRWESLLKALWLAFLANEFMFVAVPAYAKLAAVLTRLYPLEKFQPAYHCFEIAFLAWYLTELRDTGSFNTSVWGSRIQRLLGSVLCIFYSILGLAALILIADYNQIFTLVRAAILPIVPQHLFGYSKDFIAEVALFNLGQAHAGWGWTALSFYLLTAFLVWVFSRPTSLVKIMQRWKAGVGVLVIVDAFLFSWSIFPLNEKPLAWADHATSFQPTDRFYRFVDSTQTNMSLGSVEHFRNTWENPEYGRRESLNGHLETPALNLSGTKSYSPREAVEFALAAFNNDGNQRITDVRSLGTGPLYNSDLLNMAAVSYYFSQDPMTVKPPLEVLIHANQLHVYKNTAAWPYFYLADGLEIAAKTPLNSVKRNMAYVSVEDYFDLTAPAAKDSVQLTNFSFGDMEFRYTGEHERFLVVADSWHPFWKAALDGVPTAVLKANWIFKGVRLPAGAHTVRFYFDTKPYNVGIYISAAAWIVLVIIIFIRAWHLR